MELLSSPTPLSELEQIDISMCIAPITFYRDHPELDVHPLPTCIEDDTPSAIQTIRARAHSVQSSGHEHEHARSATPNSAPSSAPSSAVLTIGRSFSMQVGITCPPGLLQIIRTVMGPRAEVRSIMIDRDEPKGKIELIGSTCLCPYNGHQSHRSNNQWCSLHYAIITFYCYNESCKQTDPANVKKSEMPVSVCADVYRGKHVVPTESELMARSYSDGDIPVYHVTDTDTETSSPPVMTPVLVTAHSAPPCFAPMNYHFLSDAMTKSIEPLLAQMRSASPYASMRMYEQICKRLRVEHGRQYHLLFLMHKWDSPSPKKVSISVAEIQSHRRQYPFEFVVVYHQHDSSTHAWGVLPRNAVLGINKKDPRYTFIFKSECSAIFGLS